MGDNTPGMGDRFKGLGDDFPGKGDGCGIIIDADGPALGYITCPLCGGNKWFSAVRQVMGASGKLKITKAVNGVNVKPLFDEQTIARPEQERPSPMYLCENCDLGLGPKAVMLVLQQMSLTIESGEAGEGDVDGEGQDAEGKQDEAGN